MLSTQVQHKPVLLNRHVHDFVNVLNLGHMYLFKIAAQLRQAVQMRLRTNAMTDAESWLNEEL